MEIVGKKSQGLSVTALKDDKTVIISFNDRSLNFYVTDSLKESLKETINAKIEEGYDCVFGSRFIKGGSMPDSTLRRKLISRGGSILANFLLGTKLKDMTSGFELFSSSALQMVVDKGIISKGHFFQTEITRTDRRKYT